MRLSKEDADLFYQLWLPLLDYVNGKAKVIDRQEKMAGADSLDPAEVKKVADYLWNHTDLIDEYLGKEKELPGEYRDIIAGWKHCISGIFAVERHLKKGSILIGEKNDVYLVSGIISSWEEMLWGIRLPVFIRGTLLPFKNVIITDGLITRYPVTVGGNMAGSFREVYMEAKQSGKLISSIGTAGEEPPKVRQKADGAGEAGTEKTAKEKTAKGSGIKDKGIKNAGTKAAAEKTAGKTAGKAAGRKAAAREINRYTLKVYPAGGSRIAYRVIEISGKDTLERLAEVILQAFDFFHEHMYEFCMDNRMYSDDSYQSDPEPGERSVRVALDRTGLYKGMNFLFHYDFGDDWKFVVHVQKIQVREYAVPEVTGGKGKVVQYPDVEFWGEDCDFSDDGDVVDDDEDFDD